MDGRSHGTGTSTSDERTTSLIPATTEQVPTSQPHLQRVEWVGDEKSRGGHGLGKLSKFSRRQKYILACLCLSSATSYCVMGIMAPFFPTEAEKKGLSMTMSGLIFSIYAVVIFLACPMMGRLLSRFQAKRMLLSGMCLSGLSNIVFGFLFFIQSLPAFTATCIVTRLFDGLGSAAYITATYAITGQVFPDNIGFVLGICEIFTGLGLSVGPAIGGLLYEIGGAGLPFWLVGVFALTAAVVSYRCIPSAPLATEESTRTLGMWPLLRGPRVVVLLLAVVVVSTGWSFLDPILEPYLRKTFGVTQSMVGLFFLALSACYAVSSPLWGLLTEKLEETWGMVVVGLVGCSLAMFLLGPAPTPIQIPNTVWMKVVGMMIFGIFCSMSLLPTFGILLGLAIDRGYADDNLTLGLVSGIWASLYSLGEVLGPLTGALLTEHFSFSTTTTTVSALFILTAVLTYLCFGGLGLVRKVGAVILPCDVHHPDSDSGVSEVEHEDVSVKKKRKKKSSTQSEVSALLPSNA